MLIPIGHEESTVRRVPWVTFGVMICCVVAFIASAGGDNRAEVTFREGVQKAWELFARHPYLTLDPRLRMPEQTQTELRRRVRDQPPAELLARQQHELDQLTEAAFTHRRGSPRWQFGLIPAEPTAHGFFTHAFMHGGWMHLLGNLFILYLVGPFVEDVWGRPVYAGLYVVAAAASGAMFCLHYPELQAPLIGASGAVFGVAGAFFIRYLTTKMRFLVWILVPFGPFTAPAWMILPLLFVYELLSATARDTLFLGASGVAHWVHVWGFVVGAAVALAIHWSRLEQRFLHRAIERKAGATVNSELEQAFELERSGDVDGALRLLREVLRERPDHVEAALGYWNLARAAAREREAAPFLLRVVTEAARQGDSGLVGAYWFDLRKAAPELEITPALALRVAEMLEPEGYGRALGPTFEIALRLVSDQTPPGLLQRLAKLARDLKAPAAAELSRQVARHMLDDDPSRR